MNFRNIPLLTNLFQQTITENVRRWHTCRRNIKHGDRLWKNEKFSFTQEVGSVQSFSRVRLFATPMDCRMWVERLNEKRSKFEQVPLEGGSESFRDLRMVGSAERTARLKTLPCLTYSTQLLGLPPSGPLPAFFYYREPTTDSHCPPSIKDPVLMLSGFKHITMALKYWWQYISS